VIIGYGQYGDAIAEALVQFGISHNRILVVDTSDDARRAATHDGHRAVSHLAPATEGSRLVYVANNGDPLGEADLRACLPGIALTVKSGGTAFETSAFGGLVRDEAETSSRPGRTVFGPRGRSVLSDEVWRSESGQRLTLVNSQKPLNLAEPFWQIRFFITDGMVVTGATHVSCMTRPGIEQPAESVQESVVEIQNWVDPGPYRDVRFSLSEWAQILNDLPGLDLSEPQAHAHALNGLAWPPFRQSVYETIQSELERAVVESGQRRLPVRASAAQIATMNSDSDDWFW
jgi:hypothetical protein